MQPGSAIGKSRRETLVVLENRALRIHVGLARVGAEPAQLDQLQAMSLDETIQAELSLIAREAGWQLRALSRETRRRWPLDPGEDLPQTLERWLDDADALGAEVAATASGAANGQPLAALTT